jgi:hypothetical protein
MTHPRPLVLRHPRLTAAVQFRWTGDRYDHAIGFGEAELRTVDEHRDSDWPDCPPLQQLSIESIADRDVALGVGCAGTSHWSVSIEPTETGFRFDWACRAKQPPERLGVRYLDAGIFQLKPAEGTELRAAGRSRYVVPRPSPESQLTFRWVYEVTFCYRESV